MRYSRAEGAWCGVPPRVPPNAILHARKRQGDFPGYVYTRRIIKTKKSSLADPPSSFSPDLQPAIFSYLYETRHSQQSAQALARPSSFWSKVHCWIQKGSIALTILSWGGTHVYVLGAECCRLTDWSSRSSVR